jgi:signal peptidase
MYSDLILLSTQRLIIVTRLFPISSAVRSESEMDGGAILRRLLGPRGAVSQLVLLGLLLAHALMAYTAAEAAAGAALTPRVVLSGSMEPAFGRGDLLLFRWNNGGDNDDPIRAGDVVLFEPARGDVDVVHRVIEVRDRPDGGGADVLTKGDSNGVDDYSGYLYDEPWLQRHQVMAKAVGYLPKAGWLNVAMVDKPMVRKAVVGVLGLGVLVTALY